MHVESRVVSVVIPAFNEERRLPLYIQRIREACSVSPEIAAAYEIIVCDNNSTGKARIGRRGIGNGLWWWAKFALRLSLFPKRSVRDKEFARAWYKGDR
jgi:hypothetical protein